jgi:hypothetical protein
VTVIIEVMVPLGVGVTVDGLNENVIPDPGRPSFDVKQQLESETLPENPFMLVIVTGIVAVPGMTF